MKHEEFKQKLKDLSLNLSDFAEIVGLSYSAVSKFGKTNPVPSWVPPFLDLYEKNQNMESIKQEIKSLADKL